MKNYWPTGENTLPTYHKKIMISNVRDLDYEFTRSKIDELFVSNMFFNDSIIGLMKEIVPEYISNNSDLCRFDKEKETKPNKKEGEQPISTLKSIQ